MNINIAKNAIAPWPSYKTHVIDFIIALASATGEKKKKKKKKKKKSLGQGGAEGPDAGSFYGGGGRRPPTTRANTDTPRKKVFNKS